MKCRCCRGRTSFWDYDLFTGRCGLCRRIAREQHELTRAEVARLAVATRNAKEREQVWKWRAVQPGLSALSDDELVEHFQAHRRRASRRKGLRELLIGLGAAIVCIVLVGIIPEEQWKGRGFITEVLGVPLVFLMVAAAFLACRGLLGLLSGRDLRAKHQGHVEQTPVTEWLSLLGPDEWDPEQQGQGSPTGQSARHDPQLPADREFKCGGVSCLQILAIVTYSALATLFLLAGIVGGIEVLFLWLSLCLLCILGAFGRARAVWIRFRQSELRVVFGRDGISLPRSAWSTKEEFVLYRDITKHRIERRAFLGGGQIDFECSAGKFVLESEQLRNKWQFDPICRLFLERTGQWCKYAGRDH